MPSEERAGSNAVLYRCGRCGGQWTAPQSHDSRNCGDCRHDEPMERVGTVDQRPDGWESAGRTLEHGELEKGYRVAFEHERRAAEPGNMFSLYTLEDCDVEPPLVTGEVFEIEDTPAGPRYEIGLDEMYWYEDDPETVWIDHWEVDEVLERTKASARLADIRAGLSDD